jgi:hypothetical protein
MRDRPLFSRPARPVEYPVPFFFQEGCVEENTNIGALVRRLLSDDYADKVIACTIQKLGQFLRKKSVELENSARLVDGETELILVA